MIQINDSSGSGNVRKHTFELIIPAENKEEIMSGLSGASSIDKNSTFRK